MLVTVSDQASRMHTNLCVFQAFFGLCVVCLFVATPAQSDAERDDDDDYVQSDEEEEDSRESTPSTVRVASLRHASRDAHRRSMSNTSATTEYDDEEKEVSGSPSPVPKTGAKQGARRKKKRKKGPLTPDQRERHRQKIAEAKEKQREERHMMAGTTALSSPASVSSSTSASMPGFLDPETMRLLREADDRFRVGVFEIPITELRLANEELERQEAELEASILDPSSEPILVERGFDRDDEDDGKLGRDMRARGRPEDSGSVMVYCISGDRSRDVIRSSFQTGNYRDYPLTVASGNHRVRDMRDLFRTMTSGNEAFATITCEVFYFYFSFFPCELFYFYFYFCG